MKLNRWSFASFTLLAGLMIRTSSAAPAPDTNVPPVLPPLPGVVAPASPATSAPANAVMSEPVAAAPEKAPAKHPAKHTAKPKVAKKKPAKPAKMTDISTPLKPGPATVVVKHLNVRGQPNTRSEVVTHLTNGEPVTVIEEITHENNQPDEPTIWAKIALPAETHVWISSLFVNTSNQTVTVKKLNLRTGPGENYSVAGLLLKGDTYQPLDTKPGWIQIQAPTNAFAYVAAAYLKQEAAPEVTNAPPAVDPLLAEQALVTNAVPETTPIAPPPTDVPPGSLMDTNTPPPAPTPDVAPPVPVPPVETAPEPPPVRIVEREGVVRRTISIQAPTPFELVNPDTGRTVDYLYSSSIELDLRRYKGLRVIVTGEESLDERWVNTPVITISKILVIE
ncbi:MAG TPA: SH3 domain-containing protein [Dongiaceae bacterium]|nr:SH3 domain-containing protein [Dongiaceae bacterium]